MSDKAIPRSISFRPGWLYTEAEKYGRSLDRPENVSEVVCGFVRAGLTNAGWSLPDAGKPRRRVMVTAEEAAAIAEVRKLGGKPLDALRAAIAEIERDRELAQIGAKVGILTPYEQDREDARTAEAQARENSESENP